MVKLIPSPTNKEQIELIINPYSIKNPDNKKEQQTAKIPEIA